MEKAARARASTCFCQVDNIISREYKEDTVFMRICSDSTYQRLDGSGHRRKEKTQGFLQRPLSVPAQ